jgi:hypothetical protein
MLLTGSALGAPSPQNLRSPRTSLSEMVTAPRRSHEHPGGTFWIFKMVRDPRHGQ